MHRSHVLLLLVLGGALWFVWPESLSDILFAGSGSGATTAKKLSHAWPPALDQPYPDLELLDHRGDPFRLSSLRGKFVIVEPVGISCAACQAYAGAHDGPGGFRGVAPQRGLPSVESLLRGAGVMAGDDRVALVQILFYDMSARAAPTTKDAAEWAEHFGLADREDVHVLVGTPAYVNSATYQMIPGFQLLDQDLVLRADSTGHSPHDNPNTALFPRLRTLLRYAD